jgi:amidophosphoribosyltransferase
MSDLYHECGIAAVCHLPSKTVSRFAPGGDPGRTSELLPGMLLDIQNRGQLAAGVTTFREGRPQIIDTYKDVGTVTEVFRMNHKAKFKALMDEYAGSCGIGHVRYATCGKDDRSYAQPFERHHISRSKWFSFGFNGQLANYQQLRDEILSNKDNHLARETDTEILMHLMGRALSDNPDISPGEMLSELSKRLDGAWNMAFVNARGDMFVSRDPMGIRPLCYAVEGPMFAAASESVALTHLGFSEDSIHNLEPGHAVVIQDGELNLVPFANSDNQAHCFFEWIYFANVGSRLDNRSVYVSRKRLGEELAALEDVPVDENTIVVPVPDTAKAAADSMAYQLKVPSLEGLIRNRYIGRTFIEGTDRAAKVRMKYTPLREVLEGKRVILVEDSIVRSTTMMALLSQIRDVGRAAEIHVRVACPPIVAPCFYGIDMSTISELFAPKHMKGSAVTPDDEKRMAKAVGADTLRYLPVDAIARCVDMPRESLCQACIDGVYPTEAGRTLYQLALKTDGTDTASTRIFDGTPLVKS